MEKKDLVRLLMKDVADSTSFNKALLKKFFADDKTVEQLLGTFARSEAFERLYKLLRTANILQSGFKKADFHYVGLGSIDPSVSFSELFETVFFPRLSGNRDRATGFRRIVEALDALALTCPLIIETGSMRVPGNWQGDGQSTFIWDAYVQKSGGQVWSIDTNIDSIDTARRACSGHTNFILNDSVTALSNLAVLLPPCCVNLLYLDSYDLDLKEPLPSAVHHMMELAAVRPVLGRNCIVAIDDYRVAGNVGGKGALIDTFMKSIDAKVLHDGYQKVWQLR